MKPALWLASLSTLRRYLLLGGSILVVTSMLGGLCAWLINRPIVQTSVATATAIATATFSSTTQPVTAGRPAITPTPAPTAMPPLLTTAWHITSLPPGSVDATFTVARTNGNIAYSCSSRTTHGATDVWLTQDRGNTWSHVFTTITSAFCGVTVNDANPFAAVLTLQQVAGSRGESNHSLPAGVPLAPHTSDPYISNEYITLDAGRYWREFPANFFLDQFSSYGSTSYGFYATPGAPGQGYSRHLVVSTDGFVTWQPIDQQLDAIDNGTGGARQFWLDETNGALFVIVASNVASYLATSIDSGRSWTLKHAPAGDQDVAKRIGNAWRFCTDYTSTTADGNAYLANIVCSDDDGATWQTRQLPEQFPAGPLLGMTNVGDLLFDDSADYVNLYIVLLKRGSDQWQPLVADGQAAQFANAPGDGVLWAVANPPTLPYVVTRDYP